MLAESAAARHSRRARRALGEMAEVDPAIAGLALWCVHRDGRPATHTAGDTIFYGPEFETKPIQEQIGLAAHHILHVALRHPDRRREMRLRRGPAFDPDLFSLVCDALVNEALLLAGHALPRPAVRATELIDRALDEQLSPERALADWDAERLFFAVEAARRDNPDRRKALEDYSTGRAHADDLRDGSGGSAPEDPEEWRGRVAQALAAGRRAGLGIGALGLTLADLPVARVPWEQRLRGLLQKAVSPDPRRSYQRPAGRWVAAEDHARRSHRPVPVFEPGPRRDALRPRIVIGLDTSSSVTEEQLALFAAEAVAIAERSGAELHLLAFDTVVHTALAPGARGLRAALLTQELLRDGGTDFDPVLAEAARLAPSVLVMLTDLDAPLGPAPGFPVIWAVPGTPAKAPPFGTVLSIDR